MCHYFSSTCRRNMSPYGQILLAKQWVLVTTDFELQYTIFNLLKINVLTVNLAIWAHISPTGRSEVTVNTLFIVKKKMVVQKQEKIII